MTGLPDPFYRPNSRAALVTAASEEPPLLLTGPPGSGKTTLLRALAQDLEAQGWLAISLDLMGAASSPERFVETALSAIPAEGLSKHLGEATRIRRLAESGKERAGEAVRALFALWASLVDAGGRPVALILDEVTEIRSLAYFAGLRDVDGLLVRALGSRARGTILATSYPTLARKLWPTLATLDLLPLTGSDVRPILERRELDLSPEALVRATFGWPRHLRVLLARSPASWNLARAWTEEMAEGGRLELACRHTYETLLLRSRGYGMAKAVLAATAAEEAQNLKALVARLKRSPGAIRDYLGWLLDVDALRMVGKRYFYVDGLVRWWVRLYARGTPPGPQDLERAAREVLEEGRSIPAPAPAPQPVRIDSLMEID
jgi:DNA polymerase III delta prime subunit